ncbi:MAG: hypothetical protein M1469_09125 [Bacteroidetes bacterium]|nr:hypothetical protein [Bacteroidota bacterium]
MNYQYGGKDVRLLQFLEERVRKNSASSFFAMLSYFYLDIDRVGEALSVAQRGVIAHPNYSTGHAVLAMAMMRAGLYIDARKELQKADQLHPGSQIIERLKGELESQEQADSIGRKLAEQYRKSASSGSDIMKTVEQTLKARPAPGSQEDYLIPGLDAIIGEELSPVQASLTKPPAPAGKPKDVVKERSKERPEEEKGINTARAIIDKVAREFSDESSKERNAPDQKGPEKSEDQEFEFDVEILARKLESAAPIKPAENRPANREEDGGIELTPEIVTETLAIIFEQQGQMETAIEAYTILMKKKPEKEELYRKKIDELKSRTDEQR